MKVQDLPQPFQDRIARFNRLFQAGTLAPLIGDEGYYDDRSDLPEIK